MHGGLKASNLALLEELFARYLNDLWTRLESAAARAWPVLARTLEPFPASISRLGDATRMTRFTSAPETAEQTQLSRLCVSIRGKLQFMDYLVRSALVDSERFQDENDPGTRIFIRQLLEMHAANLRVESQNMRLVADLCAALENLVESPIHSDDSGDSE